MKEIAGRNARREEDRRPLFLCPMEGEAESPMEGEEKTDGRTEGRTDGGQTVADTQTHTQSLAFNILLGN